MKTKSEWIPKTYLDDPAGGRYAKCFLIRGLEVTPDGKRNKWHVIGYVGKRGTEGDTMPWVAHEPDKRAGLTTTGRLKDAQRRLAHLWIEKHGERGAKSLSDLLGPKDRMGEGGHEALTAPQRQQAESRSHRVGCDEPVVEIDYTPFDTSKQNDTADAEAHADSLFKRDDELWGIIHDTFLKARKTAR